MDRFYDGQEVTLKEIRNSNWIIDSFNVFIPKYTYCNKDNTLGVSFYSTDENSEGTIFRIE